MDDLLGAMLDIDDSVSGIMEWIKNNGGYEKNALYVTADHDHYLTLLPRKCDTELHFACTFPFSNPPDFLLIGFLDFPEVVANLIIDGASHDITPKNNTNVNAWDTAITAGRHNSTTIKKSQTQHLKDYSTWSVRHLFCCIVFSFLLGLFLSCTSTQPSCS